MRHIERIVKTTQLNVTGIHMHTGSEIKDIRVFLEGLEVMFNTATHFPNLEFIDLGSGFKVPYKPDDAETDIATLGEKVTQAFEEYEKETGKKLQVWFEPGKYLVSQCGFFIVKANVIKQTPSAVLLVSTAASII
jgi:diaminopimelate decarboxylase